jgi:hypothetical protein
VPYREDLDAAVARVESLERELEEAKGEIDRLKGRRSQALELATPAGALVASSQGKARRWLGAATRLRFEIQVPAATSEESYPEIVSAVREAFGNVSYSWLKTALTCTARVGNRTSVSVEVRSHGADTVITLDEDLRQYAGGIFGGIGGGGGFGPIGGVIALTMNHPTMAPVVFVGWLGSIYGICRFIFRGVARHHAARLQALGDRIVEIIRPRSNA